MDLIEVDTSSMESVIKNGGEIPNKNFLYDESLCSVCNLEKFNIECGMDKEELNHLLGFLLLRIKSWVSYLFLWCVFF